ncbi:hypothetical protein DFP95_14512, partial [Cohnella lupini]
MNLKNKMVVASLVASLALLSLNISNPVHAA